MYRARAGRIEVLLVHPGGPFWSKKDNAAWSIPKGEFDEECETSLAAAIREFSEETGIDPQGPYEELGTAKQPSGKIVIAWAFKGDWDPANLQSNTFELEWPPRSGEKQRFPEVDRAEWFALRDARQKILPGQIGFVDELEQRAQLVERADAVPRQSSLF